MSTSALFLRYIDGYTIGDLPKAEKAEQEAPGVTISTAPERMRELGYVRTADGWVYHTEAALLPQGGRMIWTKR